MRCDFFLKSEGKKVTVSIIKPTCSDEMCNIKEYMFKTFYKEAPIPIVLKVGKSQKKFVVSSMLQKNKPKKKYHRYLTTVVTSTWWDFRNTYRHQETRSKLLKVLLSFVARAGSSKSYRGISILLGTFDMLASTLWENLC